MWNPSLIPLNKGFDAGSATNTPKLSIRDATNVDFTYDGAIKPRMPWVQKDNFSQLSLSGTQTPVSTTTANRTDMTYGLDALGMFTARDATGEYAGMILKGRVFVWDNALGEWEDRYGGMPVSRKRLVEARTGLISTSGAGAPPVITPGASFTDYPAMSYDFGHSGEGLGAAGIKMWGQAGNQQASLESAYSIGCGNGAYALGLGSLMVHVPAGTNNLVLTIRTTASPDSMTQYLIATNARIPTGTGDQPCISCDYGDTHAYVAYWTTVGSANLKLLRVTLASGVVALSATVVALAGPTPLSAWISNSSVADDLLVYGYCTSTACGHQVVRMSTMVPQAPTIVTVGAIWRYITVGVCQNGNAVVMVTTSASADVVIYYRSLTTATSTLTYSYSGGGGYGVSNQPSWYLAHQPILVDGRILVGINKAPGNGNFMGTFQATTWFVVDITDVINRAGHSIRLMPTPIAKGYTDESMQFICPMSAMVNSLLPTSYRFWSVDWHGFSAGQPQLHTNTTGYDGALGLNEITTLRPQYAHGNESTILAGCVPFSMSRGLMREHGFPEDRPWMEITDLGPGGSLVAGTYTGCAVWRWVDEAGNIHRSAPSPLFTIGGVLFNDKIFLNATLPQVTTKSNVSIEFYLTDVNPTSSSPHYLQGIVTNGSTMTIAAVNKTGEFLYTDGNTLENQVPQASGGIVSLGTRIWTADGDSVYASKLPVAGFAPVWNLDDPLTVKIPEVAGTIIGLSALDDKLLVFCTRGVWAISGAGPDNIGQGPSFIDPVKLANIGLFDQRLVQATPEAVMFVGTNLSTNERVSGIYTVDRSLVVQHVSDPIPLIYDTDDFSDMYFWADRQIMFLTNQDLTLIFDGRRKQWAQWTIADSPYFMASAGLFVYGVTAQAQGRLDPQSTSIGTDTISGAPSIYAMSLDIEQIPSNNELLGWGRVRSVELLTDFTLTPYNLTINASLDNRPNITSSVAVAGAVTTTWPTSPGGPEWRLPTQKCSRLGVSFSISPAVATVTGLKIVSAPINGKAPAKQRF